MKCSMDHAIILWDKKGDVDMKEIGELLKAKRLEKGLTIEEIVSRTKMPAARIIALEEGDISAFKDDLTYLQFFLQSYCRAVDIDYSQVKGMMNDSINQYTTHLDKTAIQEHLESEKNIQKQSSQYVRDYQAAHPNQVKRKIDFSLFTFIAVVAVIVICLVVAVGFFLKQRNDVPAPPNVIEEPEKPTIDKPTNEKPEEPVKPELTVSKTDATHFVVENATEKFIVKVEFSKNCWFNGMMDQYAMSTPAARIYNASESFEIEVDPLKNKEIYLNFGVFNGVKLYVNDKAVEMDASIASNPSTQSLTISIGGNNRESAQ